MLVNHRAMLMPVAVRFAGRGPWIMGMLVMLVMNVCVFVGNVPVRVFMAMALGNVEPDADRHQRGGDHHLCGDRLGKQRNTQHRSDKRRCGEVSAGSGGTQIAEREHKQDEAYAIARQTHDTRTQRGAERWKPGADKDRKGDIHKPRRQALDGRDLHGVSRTDFPRQVVVDAPGEARAPDRDRSHVPASEAALPGQDERADQYREGPEQQTPIDTLAKDQPGNARGRETFEVQEQRGRRCLRRCQAKHQEEGPDDAAGHDRTAQPGQIGSAERSLARSVLHNALPGQQQGQAHARAEIEHARQQPRVDAADQQFGKRSTCAEQRSGPQRHHDATSSVPDDAAP